MKTQSSGFSQYLKIYGGVFFFIFICFFSVTMFHAIFNDKLSYYYENKEIDSRYAHNLKELSDSLSSNLFSSISAILKAKVSEFSDSWSMNDHDPEELITLLAEVEQLLLISSDYAAIVAVGIFDQHGENFKLRTKGNDLSHELHQKMSTRTISEIETYGLGFVSSPLSQVSPNNTLTSEDPDTYFVIGSATATGEFDKNYYVCVFLKISDLKHRVRPFFIDKSDTLFIHTKSGNYYRLSNQPTNLNIDSLPGVTNLNQDYQSRSLNSNDNQIFIFYKRIVDAKFVIYTYQPYNSPFYFTTLRDIRLKTKLKSRHQLIVMENSIAMAFVGSFLFLICLRFFVSPKSLLKINSRGSKYVLLHDQIKKFLVKDLDISLVVLNKAEKICWVNNVFLNEFLYSKKDIQKINVCQLFQIKSDVLDNKCNYVHNSSFLFSPENRNNLVGISSTGRWFDVAVTLSKQIRIHSEELLVLSIQNTSNLIRLQRKVSALEDKVNILHNINKRVVRQLHHELRTPIHIISGQMEMLESFPTLDKHQLKCISSVNDAKDELLYKVDKVLEVCHVLQNDIKVSLSDVKFKPIIENVLKQNARKVSEKKLNVSCLYNDLEERMFSADISYLTTAVHNIIENSIKFNRFKGSIIIELSTENDRYIKLSVKDTGVGILDGELAYIFQPFLSSNEGPLIESGKGLGLFVAKGLVEAMGGTLGVESFASKGSTFWLKFSLDN